MQWGISWRGLLFSTPDIIPHMLIESIPGRGKGVPSYR